MGHTPSTSETARRQSSIAALVRLGSVFLVHCPDTDRIYAVPVGDSGVLKTASLRVTPPANNQAAGIRWAADYELPT